MSKDVIIIEGEILENLPNTTFRVKVEGRGEPALCHLSGKMRLNRIKVIPGDRVRVELTPYDEKRGRIIYRIK